MKTIWMTVAGLLLASASAAVLAAGKCEGRAPACAVCKDGSWDHSACKPETKPEPKPEPKPKDDKKK